MLFMVLYYSNNNISAYGELSQQLAPAFYPMLNRLQ